MTDLTEFLLARIAEDEANARAILTADYASYAADWSLPASATVDVGGEDVIVGDRILANHIARWDPARVLAECDAKRWIVAVLTDGGRLAWGRTASANRDVLRYLALPYADHPDYDETWRP